MKKLSAIGEFGLIGLLRKQFSGSRRRGRPEVIKGIGDDTAVLPFHKDKYLLFTTDMIVEGVHFTKKSPPEATDKLRPTVSAPADARPLPAPPHIKT